MNQHTPFRELLAARLDRPLTRVELRSLSAHLKGCESCRQADADYLAQRHLLRALRPPPVPRDLWARTSAALDREVARGVRPSWGRRVRRARRHVVPASTMLTTIAAVGVVAALTAFQLGPASVPSTSEPNRPTPFAVSPQAFAFVGMGSTDLAVYRMTVTQVCPQSAPLDCVPTNRIVRTPIGVGLPNDIHAGNIALSPTGRQLALVGRNTRHDVIAVVMMPDDNGSGAIPTEPVDSPDSTKTPDDQATPAPEATASPETPPAETTATPTEPTDTPAAQTPAASDGPSAEPAATPATSPSRPPESAVPGLAVLNILENVRSAGSPPAWSRNGEMLAFSAMPVDGSHGPDVYIWSPSDTHARPITTDHGSYFASWSDNRIVVSRLGVVDDDVVERNLVIDPQTLEERRASAGPVWLPAVNVQGTLAVVWHGQLDIADGRPDPRSGALYLMDWSGIDPFRATEPGDVDGEDDEPTPAADGKPSQAPEGEAESDTDVVASASDVPEGLVALEADRDPRSAPVVDWQVGWSPDGQVLGLWIADSAGSGWGRLTVLSLNTETGRVQDGETLLGPTLARRGFSLGADRVAWVAPSDDNVDGELRIRAWGSDGVGGLRVISPEQEEVLPAF